MSAVTQGTGSAERWGPVWGARPEGWAAMEEQQDPTYEAAIREVGLERGQHVLDIGCGAGVFLRLAADRCARVFGLDASEGLVEVARKRVPEADIRVGDMEALPFDNDVFDLVTGFNSFFFADDMVAALREAGRVAKPSAQVVIQVWGPPEACDLKTMKDAVAPFLPAPPPTPDLSDPGVLEGIATDAGLLPLRVFRTAWAYEYPDEEALMRSMLAAAFPVMAIEIAGEEPVREAILTALARYRQSDGTYRLSNEWHTLVASA